MYASKNRAPKYMKQKLTKVKGEIKNSTIRDFNTPLSMMNRTTRQKIIRKIKGLYNIINQPALTNIQKTFYPTIVEYTLFSSTHGTLSRIKHMLGHKTSQNKFKIMKTTLYKFYAHIQYIYINIKIDVMHHINYIKKITQKCGNSTNKQKLSNTLLIQQQVKENIKLRQIKVENTTYQNSEDIFRVV